MEWSWYVLLVIPIAFFFELCVHEGSHLYVAWLGEGRKPLGFYPYPHKHNGRWVLGRCKWGLAKEGNEEFSCLKHLAPVFSGTLIVLIATLLLLFLAGKCSFFVLPFMFCGIIDILWFWRGYFWGSEKCDGKRFRRGE